MPEREQSCATYHMPQWNKYSAQRAAGRCITQSNNVYYYSVKSHLFDVNPESEPRMHQPTLFIYRNTFLNQIEALGSGRCTWQEK